MPKFSASAIADECVPILLQPVHKRRGCPTRVSRAKRAHSLSACSHISHNFASKHLEAWVKPALYLYHKLSPLKVSVFFT